MSSPSSHDIKIRPALHRDKSDYSAFVTMFNLLGSGDIPPNNDLWEKEIAKDTLFAEAGSQHLGYIHHQKFAKAAYLRNLAIMPQAQRRGIARRLLIYLRNALCQDCIEEWHLNVLPNNQAAIKLYESQGFQLDFEMHGFRLPFNFLDRLPIPMDRFSFATAAPDTFSDLEREFGLIPGFLQWNTINRQRCVIRLAREKDAKQKAIAVFDPHFPGASPFRANGLHAATALLADLRNFSLTRYDYIRFLLEDNSPLAKEFEALGCDKKLDLLHYRGLLT